jgi:SAM-dependent methyltransferase
MTDDTFFGRLRNRVTVRLRSTGIARQLTITFYRKVESGTDESEPVGPLLNLADRKPDTPSVKLNVGGGKGHPKVDGWTVVDLRPGGADLVLDLAESPLPYDDNSVDVIFTSHTLEHIYPQRLEFVLGELHRVLKEGTGLLRVSVPDIAAAVQAYHAKDYSFFYNSDVGYYDPEAPIGGLLAAWFYSTRVFKDPELKQGEGHVHCFDYDYLVYWLRRVGFRQIRRSAYQRSVLPELRSPEFDRYPHDSLFVEAVK